MPGKPLGQSEISFVIVSVFGKYLMLRLSFIANMLFKSYSVEGMFLVDPYFSNSRLKFIYFFGINSFLILQFLLLVPLQAIQYASDLKLGHYMKVGNVFFC